MGKIVFVTYDGVAHETELVAGDSLMRIATGNGIAGIDGDCGGECACGTCHVVIAADWTAAVGGRTPAEEEMLAMNPDCVAASRLACQIRAVEEFDGLTVHVPEFQM